VQKQLKFSLLRILKSTDTVLAVFMLLTVLIFLHSILHRQLCI